MIPGFFVLLTVFKDLTKGEPVLANRHPMFLVNVILFGFGFFDTYRGCMLRFVVARKWAHCSSHAP